jgi:hypothetical protein
MQEPASALDRLLSDERNLHARACPASSGDSACNCGRDALLAEARAALAELCAQRGDYELMLRALIPCSGIYGGPKAPDGQFILAIANDTRVPVGPNGLPALTPAARQLLQRARDLASEAQSE